MSVEENPPDEVVEEPPSFMERQTDEELSNPEGSGDGDGLVRVPRIGWWYVFCGSKAGGGINSVLCTDGGVLLYQLQTII